jgi:hypothetical protein
MKSGNNELAIVKELAEKGRQWAENYQKENSVTFWEDKLNGLCAIASAELFKLLSDAPLPAKPRIAINSHHCFVLYKNCIIDVTATQFGYERKIIIKNKKKTNKYFWERKAVFNNLADLRKHQDETGWRQHQRIKIDEMAKCTA